MAKKLDNKECIQKCIKKHGNRYDYSLFNYKDYKTKVKIICPKHGVFEQLYYNHVKGSGCPICSGNKSYIKNTKHFIKESRKIFGDRYDYSKTKFNGINKNIVLIKDGIKYNQKASTHLKGYYVERNKHNMSLVIKKCKEIFGNKYIYNENIKYKNVKQKIKIICPKHGDFIKTINKHLNSKQGCPKCSKEEISKKLKNKNYIRECKILYPNLDFSKTKYINTQIDHIVICPKHGDFKTKPVNFFYKKRGCPKCRNAKSKGEEKIENFLKRKRIKYHTEYKFKDLKDKKLLRFDFYLPNYNIAIEYDGIQHFEKREYFGGEKYFKDLIKKDKMKTKYCKKNNITLIRISYKQYNNINKILNFNISI